MLHNFNNKKMSPFGTSFIVWWVMRGFVFALQKQFVGCRLKESQINLRFLLGSYHERTLRVLAPLSIRQKLNKEPLALSLISGG